MVFNNEKQLKGFLLKKSQEALIKAQEKVYKIIDLHVQRFYADYDPEMYQRTYQLMRSLVKGDVHSTGNGYEAEVYFDLGYIYGTGSHPSGVDVMDVAAIGGHGANGLRVVYFGGEDAWHTPNEILDEEAIKILVQELKAVGVPIK